MRTHILGLVAATLALVDVTTAAASTHLTAAQAREWTIFAPQPAYPETARARGIQGSGYFKLIVRVKTGRIQRIEVFRSTGSSILDDAAIHAFRQWRFKPDVLPSIRKLYPPSKEPDADKNACILVPLSFVR